MPSIMLVDEIATSRQELSRALEAEGFHVVPTDSAASAVRELWEGSFIVVFIASGLEGKNAQQLSDQLRDLAPEIETIIYAKNDEPSRLVRKACDIRDGVAAA